MPSFNSKNSLFYFSIIFTSLMVLDVISTKIALSQGHNEQNPIMQGIVNNTILFILLKLSVTGVIIIMIKKCIEQDRKTAIYGMRILSAFMLLVVIGNLIVLAGSASSGTLVLSDSVGTSYNQPVCGGGGCTQAWGWNYILFDIANYNKITKLEITVPSTAMMPLDSDTTTFTLSSGATGSGTASYSKNESRITWYFTDAVFSSTSAVITYANPTFLSTVSLGIYSSSAPSISQPARISYSTTQAQGQAGYYISQTQLRVENTYVYSEVGNLFTASISKTTAGGVPTQIQIKNASGNIYTSESSFDTTGFNFTGELNCGVKIYMFLTGGAYTYTTLNNSCASPGTPIIREYPTTGANIYTDFPSYVVGDNINVEWFIAEDPYDNIGTRCRFLINDAAIVSDVPAHDNYTILNPAIGSYKLNIACGIIWYTSVAETTVNVVAEGQSYILIQNRTAKAGSLNNFTYKWGFTPSSYRWLNIYKFDAVKNTWIKESSNSIQLASTANIIYTSQALIKSDGKYYAEICDNNRGCPTAKVLFDSTYEANVPIYSYGFSNISILNPQATYAQNDWLSFNTRIDGTNFSSGKSFSVRLYNPSTTTTKTLQYIHNENENNNVYLDSAMESGTQKLQLVGTNSSGTYVLNQTDIIISLLDANGFALYADKYNNVCPKESVIITAISPQNSTLTLSTVPIRRYNFTGSKTIEIKSNQDYTASLDTQGNQNKLISIFVNSSCVLNPIEVPGTPTAPQTMNNLIAFLSLPAFWGILLFIFCVIGTAWKAPGAVGIVALIISNLEAIIGLWSPYTIYVFIVTWIIAAIFFTLGRNTTTGGDK